MLDSRKLPKYFKWFGLFGELGVHNQDAPSFWACNLCEICFEELSNIIENLHFLLDTSCYSQSQIVNYIYNRMMVGDQCHIMDYGRRSVIH